MVKTFQQRSHSGAYYIETVEIEQRKLLRNWNGHNFLTRMTDLGASYIETLEI